MSDTRIPYGAMCTWWDSIDKVGLTAARDGGVRIPCCPVCRRPLFEVESEDVWWEGARKHEANGHPGYVDMLKWSRGQCYPTFRHMEAAYLSRAT